MVLGSVQNGTLYCRAAVILLYLSLILLQLLVKKCYQLPGATSQREKRANHGGNLCARVKWNSI